MLAEPAQLNRVAPVPGSPAQVRVLADDLTGACDAGVAFLDATHSVRVWFHPRALFPAPETAQAFHTGSRGMTGERAAEAVSQMAANLAWDANTILFKKVDSAGRGPIAAEVIALHRSLGTKAILLAPAFPAAGRTVSGGILKVRDACGRCLSLDLRTWFAPAMQNEIALISSASEVGAALDSGKTLLLCDGVTQNDLEELARAAQPLRGLLYAGSAGLARAIAGLHVVSRSTVSTPRSARTLVITGTQHPVTTLQLETLEQKTQGREDVRILRITCEDGDEAKVRAAFADFDPESLILTGGDTAQLAAQALEAHSLLLHGEFEAGIPWGTLQGGIADGRTGVTKSGGFGSAATLHDIIAKLSGAA
jgi:uncharacterized protein YgbK (DUF1537 family)